MAQDPFDADLLYRQGVAAIKAGNLDAGRQRLAQLLKNQPNHADAWVWLSAAVETDPERTFCLKKALAIDPHHEAARERLARLTGAPPPPSPAPEPPAAPPPPPEPEPEPEPVAPPPEPEPEPKPAGPDESWRQPFVEGTWEPAAEDDETADITEGWHEAGAAPEPEEAAAETEEPAAETTTAEAAEELGLDEREAWRAALYEAEDEPEEAEPEPKKRKRPDRTALEIMEQKAARPAGYGILDLFDAWAQALYFKVQGAYEDTVHYGGFGYTVLTLVIAGVLSAVSSVLLFQLVLAPMGGVQAIVAEVGMLEDTTPEAITFLTRFFSNLGLGIAIYAFLQVVFGRLVYGVMLHVVAGLFGGKGSLSETLSALSLATIARTIVMLIPVLMLVFSLLLSLPTGLVMGVGGLFYFAWFAYVWIVEVTALRTAHPQLSVLAAVGAVVAIGVLASLFVCCLSFGAGALGASGAS